MRITRETREKLLRWVDKQLWSDGWATEIAKPLIEYISCDECKVMNRAKSAAERYPGLIRNVSHEVIVIADVEVTECAPWFFRQVSLPVSFPYAVTDGSITLRLLDDGTIRDDALIRPKGAAKKALDELMAALKERALFHFRLDQVIQWANTTERLLEIVPAMEDAIKEVCPEALDDTTADDALDAASRRANALLEEVY